MRIRMEWAGNVGDSEGWVNLLKSLGGRIVEHTHTKRAANKEKHNITLDFAGFTAKPQPIEPKPRPAEASKPLPTVLYVVYHLNRPVLIVMDENAALEAIGTLQSNQAAVYRRTGYEALPFNLTAAQALEHLERERLGDEEWERRYKD